MAISSSAEPAMALTHPMLEKAPKRSATRKQGRQVATNAPCRRNLDGSQTGQLFSERNSTQKQSSKHGHNDYAQLQKFHCLSHAARMQLGTTEVKQCGCPFLLFGNERQVCLTRPFVACFPLRAICRYNLAVSMYRLLLAKFVSLTACVSSLAAFSRYISRSFVL